MCLIFCPLITMTCSGYLRTFLPTGHNKPVPQGGVHGEDWTTVSLGHHSYQEVFPPNVHISIDSASEGQVILEDKWDSLLSLCLSSTEGRTHGSTVTNNNAEMHLKKALSLLLLREQSFIVTSEDKLQ